ncbi:MAG: hypothetical protein IJJ22_04875 [Oscillospiraceae bacterium]|nr:hypothetical protein [Oscillospiraceae bacterium]
MKELLSKLNIKKVFGYALYMLLVLVFQTMFLTQIRPLGVCCMFLPAAVAAVGMFEAPVPGAVFALILGVFADMAFVENEVLFTVLFPVLSFATGFVCRFFINRRFFAFIFTSIAALTVTAVVQMVRTAVGDAWSLPMLSTVLLQVLWSIPPAVLTYFGPAKWIK